MIIEAILAKLAGVGLAAKGGVAAGAVVLSGTAVAATGSLPEPAQARVAVAVESVLGRDIPGGSRADAEHRADADHRPDSDASPGDARNDGADTADKADFGQHVSGMATAGAPREDGRQFGQNVSASARERFQPAARPTADDNPGTAHAGRARRQAPEPRPTADLNPGTAHRP